MYEKSEKYEKICRAWRSEKSEESEEDEESEGRLRRRLESRQGLINYPLSDYE